MTYRADKTGAGDTLPLPKILIIGYGNTLRGDDGVGVVVAEQLREKINTKKVKIIIAHQLYPEMLEQLIQFERVIFIDASIEGRGGTFRHHHLSADFSSKTIFLHTLTPQHLMEATQKIYGICLQADLVTITGESFELGECLSLCVEAILPKVIAYVLELIN